MNPYDFVRINWDSPPQRRQPVSHHKFHGVSGQAEGIITAETPLFIRDPRAVGRGTLSFMRSGRTPIIPGSSLKGMVRALVETIGPGCFLLFDGRYREHSWPTNVDFSDKLPDGFEACHQADGLCIACRMFGALLGRTCHGGYVTLSDARLTQEVRYNTVHLPPLFKPRTYHEAWYLSRDKRRLAGRKFYFHHAQPYLKGRQGSYTQTVSPLGPGSTFTFSLNFYNLDPSHELPLLLYALTLEPTMRHKIGYAKPAGLGTVKIELTKLAVFRDVDRYTHPDRRQVLTDEALAAYLEGQTRLYHNDNSATLADLRRIWQWPAVEPPGGYGYPPTNWFEANPRASIADSWDAPRQ